MPLSVSISRQAYAVVYAPTFHQTAATPKRDAGRPVVCFDENPTQLIGEVRPPIPAKLAQIKRSDCEYKHNGTVKLLVFLDAHRPGRKVKVTDSRAAVDFAACMRELTDIHFPNSERIRVVLDNLSTHSASDAILGLPRRRSPTRAAPTRVPLCPYYTRLNLVEIEIGVLRRQYLQRRIATKQQLVSQIAAGNTGAMPQALASNGCSQPRKPAPKSTAPT